MFFLGCLSLKRVQLSNNIVNIQNGTFFSCHSLEEINLNRVCSISSLAFYECNKLTKVNLSKEIDDLDSNAFANCENLLEINIDKKTSILLQ